ncbi:hypothetical protein [Clostridium weizhouense]|uniref:Uncharacterized protein n=1 Tax=Clostridium weizhouense TaxID=2859781 RepID=A0ABS7AQ08_9CLOT|nr:hypothetical protein [Clostridium weizhouense]MBW6410753.1 hypothetical protein [Clostridium weizhouense]
MKIDWCKSKKLNLNLTKEQEVSLVCGSTISGLKQLFVLFYLFFPSKWIYLDYLSDDKVIFENNNTLTWNNIKDIGIKKFILKYGIVRWGIPTGILYSILMLLVDSNIHSIKSFIISTVINILIFSLLGGSLFGIVIWKFLKNKNT